MRSPTSCTQHIPRSKLISSCQVKVKWHCWMVPWGLIWIHCIPLCPGHPGCAMRLRLHDRDCNRNSTCSASPTHGLDWLSESGRDVPLSKRFNLVSHNSKVNCNGSYKWSSRLEHDNECTVLKWPQLPVLNPMENLCDVVEREIRIMDVQPNNMQQLCDVQIICWSFS